MKFSIRRNVFETNSSSTHSLTICLDSEYEKWCKGEMLWDRYKGKIVPIPEDWKPYDINNDKYYYLYTYERSEEISEYEWFNESYTTPSGDKVTVFGYYGIDN